MKAIDKPGFAHMLRNRNIEVSFLDPTAEPPAAARAARKAGARGQGESGRALDVIETLSRVASNSRIRLYLKAMEIRNIAIIAHVDHGKTTLVDKMLRQAGAFRENQVVAERVMDSNPLERERGITILAKNTSIRWKDTKINIVDTPGHADFGGEVERILRMVDGVLLVVDAFDGPMPQTRFVLRKALELGRTPIVVINKIDRPGADPMRVHDEVLDLFIELEADEAQLDAPVVYASAREGVATMDLDVTPVGSRRRCSTRSSSTCRRRRAMPTAPFQMLISTIDLLAVPRPARHRPHRARHGEGRRPGGAAAAGHRRRTDEQARVTKLYGYEGLERIEVQQASAGEIVSLAGLEGVEIGLTVTDVEHPERLEGIAVEEPTISVDFIVNNSPFAGKEGKFVTSRQLRERLYKELERNVALRVEDTDSTDTWTVSRPRRAASLDSDGDDAARGLRVPGVASARDHARRGRTASGSSRTRSWRSTCPRSISAR